MSEEVLYKYKSEKTALLKRLKTALTQKTKPLLTRSGKIRPPHRVSGSGFLAEEIIGIHLTKEGKVKVITPAFTLEQDVSDYNVRELEEMIRYLEKWVE